MPLPNDQVSEWVTNLKKIRELCGKYNPDATKGGLNDFAKKKLSELLQGAALVRDRRQERISWYYHIHQRCLYLRSTDGLCL